MEQVPDSKCNISNSGRNGAAETLMRESLALRMDIAENNPELSGEDFEGIGTSSPGTRTKDSFKQERNVKVSVSTNKHSDSLGVLPACKSVNQSSGRGSDTSERARHHRCCILYCGRCGAVSPTRNPYLL